MYGQIASENPGNLCSTVAGWGANVISPLFKPAQRGATAVNAFLAAAKARNLVVGFNADHAREDIQDATRNEATRAWLCEPAIVAACNVYGDLFLEIEVELGGVTDASWVTAAQGLVNRLRTAGHLSMIKLGAGSGGRDPMHAIRNAAKVTDPLGAGYLCYTCQAYYERVVSGWSYQGDVLGLSPTATDPGGAKGVADLLAQSNLPWIVGLDREDDVGVTVYAELAPELKRVGIGWQWWVLTGDFRSANNMVDWDLNPNPPKETATIVSALLKA
jgi:Predicted N6-adenine-specific DNA methylase